MNKISYSNLLIRFIEPLLNGQEIEEEFLMKAKLGQIIWNYSILEDDKSLPDNGVRDAYKKSVSENAEMKEVCDLLVVRKIEQFQEYNNFIFNVECRHNPDGSTNLHVESAPLKKNM